MDAHYYLGLDQGTTGTMAILFDETWHVAAEGYCEIPLLYPRPGWVEHDPESVWSSVRSAIAQALIRAGISASAIRCIGLNHEGESVVIWDKETGAPIYNAIGWQDRRTAHEADDMSYTYNELVRSKTGLMIDTYFSALKYKWILDHVDGAREALAAGRLLAGTMDTWILWKMTHGGIHVTDASTASRTMLYNTAESRWDDELIDLFDLKASLLPEICDSAMVYCHTDPAAFFGVSVPVSAILVDQQAALVGNSCVDSGSIKVTYGTGCFMLMNTGSCAVSSAHGLLPTVAWRLGGKTTFALDGGVYVTGGAIRWMENNLGFITSPTDAETMAGSVDNNGGVYFVPAFTGLAAPHWDSYASGMMIGLNAGTQKAHMVRAALEATAYQVRDVLDAMSRDSSVPITAIRCSGSYTNNRFLMQFQSDILNIPLEIPTIANSTALGSAFMGALGLGDYSSVRDVAKTWSISHRYEPRMSAEERSALLYNWHRAVERAKYWVE